MRQSNSIGAALRELDGYQAEQLIQKDPEELDRLAELLSVHVAKKIDWDCAQDALLWLQQHTFTENPKYLEQGLPFRAPFPQKQYFASLFKVFATYRRLMVPKSRDLMTTWAICGFAAHRAQWFQEEIVFQSLNEDKSKEGVEYVRQLYDNQDEALKKLHPLRSRSTTEIAWLDGGRFVGIPAQPDAIRSYHPTRFVLDEAAHNPAAKDSWEAAHPVCPFMVAISTAAPGFFGDQCARGAE